MQTYEEYRDELNAGLKTDVTSHYEAEIKAGYNIYVAANYVLSECAKYLAACSLHDLGEIVNKKRKFSGTELGIYFEFPLDETNPNTYLKLPITVEIRFVYGNWRTNTVRMRNIAMHTMSHGMLSAKDAKLFAEKITYVANVVEAIEGMTARDCNNT